MSTELRLFGLSHFSLFLAMQGTEFMQSTPPTVFNGYFSDKHLVLSGIEFM